MKHIKVIAIATLLVILFFVGTFFYGRHVGKKISTETPSINSQTILDKITDQYFLVTKTVFIDSKAEIEISKNYNWTDLFVGKKISVSGLVRIDVGLEMKNMGTENINIDDRSKTVTITLPPAEILDASLSGELSLIQDKAVLERLKDIFSDTENEDYNLAMLTIINNAKSQVIANEDIFAQARLDSLHLIELIVSEMLDDYQVIIK